MNQGLKNDPETMSELRGMQESLESAREFIAKNPKGKPYLLRNKRPARMSAELNVGRTPYTPMPSGLVEHDGVFFIEFFNHLHIFGFEVERPNLPKTPVFVGVQFVLTSAINRTKAAQLAREVQELLTNPISNVRDVFLEWGKVALTVYEECNHWIERGTPVSDVGPFSLRTETGQENVHISSDLDIDVDTTGGLVPEAMFTSSSKRQDAFNFLPEEAIKLEYPSASKIPSVEPTEDSAHESAKPDPGASRAALKAAMRESGIIDSGPIGSDGGHGSSTIVHSKYNLSLNASSNWMRPEKSAPLRSLRKHENAAHHVRDLLEKVKDIENVAYGWAAQKKDKHCTDLVKELATLREALCDDFAADLNLYIAFYCASKELQEQ
jgi:hypothetical protein